MPLETFTGDAVAPLLQLAQETFGPEAQVVRLEHKAGRYVLTAGVNLAPRPAAAAPAAPDFRDLLGQRMQAAAAATPKLPEGRPLVLALVGPTGAGKTTAIAKLAMSPQAFGGRKVGLIGLDTWRVGAVEQLAIWAEIARMPMTIVWTADEAPAALEGLSDCEVVLVDTPGRSPAKKDDLREVREVLAALQPDETHLVIPAGRLWRMHGDTVDAWRGANVTHLLASKMDECPDDWGVFEMALARNIPMRWISDGQDVPADLRPAADRLAGAVERRPALRRDARIA